LKPSIASRILTPTGAAALKLSQAFDFAGIPVLVTHCSKNYQRNCCCSPIENQ
jgi:hypothetical protein